MAQGAPSAAGRAHFHSNRHGAADGLTLLLPPRHGIVPGGFEGVVVVIQDWVSGSVAIHQPIQALLLGPGAERRQGRRRNQGIATQSP